MSRNLSNIRCPQCVECRARLAAWEPVIKAAMAWQADADVDGQTHNDLIDAVCALPEKHRSLPEKHRP